MFPSSKNIDGSNIDLTNYYTKTEINTLINSQGQAYIPCGSVQAFMTTTAPQGYLVCDGTEYLKSAYPQLAAVLSTVDTTQGTTLFVGSDNDHFKIPDLRGEFLRGTGTNSHTHQGSGANVGVHQDGTTSVAMEQNTSAVIYKRSNASDSVQNADFTIRATNEKIIMTQDTGSGSSVLGAGKYTSRPTNTSVLYCIAYQDLYITPLHQYSTEEHVVGTWIDGKPIYEKVIVTTLDVIPAERTWYPITDISNVDTYVSFNGMISDYQIAGYSRTIPYSDSASNAFFSVAGFNASHAQYPGRIQLLARNINIGTVYITARYTKTTDL